jgi:hypothetical protein
MLLFNLSSFSVLHLPKHGQESVKNSDDTFTIWTVLTAWRPVVLTKLYPRYRFESGIE